MKKPWYKKWWVWVLAALILAFVVPCIINELYKREAGYLTLWGADDVLGFYGAFLSFVGTFVLGLAAYSQNEKLNKRQQNNDAANTLTPYFTMDVSADDNKGRKVSFENSHYIIEGRKATISLTNKGLGIAVNVEAEKFFGKWRDDIDHKMKETVGIDEAIKMTISLTEKACDEIKTRYIIYENILGYKYKQVISYKLVHNYKQINEDNDYEDTYCLFIYSLGEQKRIGFQEDEQ